MNSGMNIHLSLIILEISDSIFSHLPHAYLYKLNKSVGFHMYVLSLSFLQKKLRYSRFICCLLIFYRNILNLLPDVEHTIPKKLVFVELVVI